MVSYFVVCFMIISKLSRNFVRNCGKVGELQEQVH